MRRSDRWAFAVLRVGVAATLGGVQLAAMLDAPPTPLAAESEFCPERPGGAARPDTGYAESGEPYRGGRPHPVAFNLRYAEVGNVDVPDRWKPGQDGSPPGPQLVACVYQDTADSRRSTRRTTPAASLSKNPTPRSFGRPCARTSSAPSRHDTPVDGQAGRDDQRAGCRLTCSIMLPN
ncbi:hypothetical protein GCM10009546_27320 [Actinomadura livida]|uniref:Uncharacterized protein n=1 Tax=Actinomadura livida TaxID=79909 RepID=A0ABP3PBG5_9ACTN